MWQQRSKRTDVKSSIDEAQADAEPVERLTLALDAPLIDARNLWESMVDNEEKNVGRERRERRESR